MCETESSVPLLLKSLSLDRPLISEATLQRNHGASVYTPIKKTSCNEYKCAEDSRWSAQFSLKILCLPKRRHFGACSDTAFGRSAAFSIKWPQQKVMVKVASLAVVIGRQFFYGPCVVHSSGLDGGFRGVCTHNKSSASRRAQSIHCISKLSNHAAPRTTHRGYERIANLNFWQRVPRFFWGTRPASDERVRSGHTVVGAIP